VLGQTGLVMASDDGMTLRHHRGKAPRPRWRHGGSAAHFKPSSSPYRIRGRMIWLRRQMTFTEPTGAAWHGIAGGCLHRGMPHGATFRAWPRMKNPTLGPTILGTPSRPCAPVERVGNFQILVRLSSMNTNINVSFARIFLLNEDKQHKERWYPPPKGGTGGLESSPMRDPSVSGGLPTLKTFGKSTSTDDLIRSAMVRAGGVDGAAGWKTKALDGIRSSGERRQ
jgi:hypothetical protein